MKKKEKIEAKATQLANLIDYQDGSVVSRTLIDKENGTVRFSLSTMARV
jgi:hypothetical protein